MSAASHARAMAAREDVSEEEQERIDFARSLIEQVVIQQEAWDDERCSDVDYIASRSSSAPYPGLFCVCMCARSQGVVMFPDP